jgi:hypothetical protein
LKRFTFHDVIGKTAVGDVYLVTVTRDDGISDKMAAHIIDAPRGGIDMVAQLLRAVSRTLVHLEHPNILPVQELALVDDHLVILREHHEGGQLSGCVKGGKRLEPSAVAGIMSKVAETLDAAWNTADASGQPLQVAHQNLAPEHIILTDQGKIMLIDFGVAKILSIKSTTGHAEDMYGFANTLFALWTGEPFLKGFTLTEKTKLLSDAPRYATFIEERLELMSAMGEDAKELQRTLLSLDPENRPSATRTAKTLANIFARKPVTLWGLAESIPAETRITKMRGKTLYEEEWRLAGPVWEDIQVEEEEDEKAGGKGALPPPPPAEPMVIGECLEMSNKEIAAVVVQMADLMEMSGTEEQEVWAVRNHAHDIEEVSDKLYVLANSGRLQSHPNLSPTALRMTRQILNTGTLVDLEVLKKQVPSGLNELRDIGLSPRTVGLLHNQLQVTSMLDLKTVFKNGKLGESKLGRHAKQEVVAALNKRRSPFKALESQNTLVVVAAGGLALLGIGGIIVWMMAG